ncbi:MAG: CDP-alcohol phosphatidyltransferase family protein [Porticoccaceae bacterium]
MANLITLSRLILLGIVICILYFGSPLVQLFNVLLLILIFVSDGVDGYVARRFNEESLFGAVFDIAADRIVELCLWIALAHIGALPVWIPLVFVARGVLTDAIRAVETETKHQTPFATMRTSLGKALVAGRFMRAFYAVLKAVTFCVVMFALPLPVLAPQLWRDYGELIRNTGLLLAYASVFICILRGAPVIIEFIDEQRSDV